MSKVVGKILTIASIAFAIVGGPLALGFFLAGATLLNNALMSKAKKGATDAAAERQASETTVKIGEQARGVIFGRAATAGTLADAFNHGGQYGTDWEVYVFLLADHRCDALEGFWVSDKYETFAGDGAVAGYNGQLEVHWRAGTEDQVPPAVLTEQGGWASTDRLVGVSYVVAAFKADAADAQTPTWPGGRPGFLWQLRGLLLYDPRLDSTVAGGAGPHRWDDPSTREWGENAEICRYNYDRGIYACDRIDEPGMLLVGRGLSAIEAPPEQIFPAANICDEDVALAAGGTEPRYRVGGVIYANEEFGNVTEDFAAAMGGVVVQPEGGIGVEPGHAKSPVAYLTDADFISGTKISAADFRSEADDEWVNTVMPRYVEPTQKWADHGAPIRRNSAHLIADGGSREAPLSLRLVTSSTQAQRVGEIKRRLGRLWKTRSGTLGPRFAGIEEGDWVVWTSARHSKGLPVTYQVTSFALPENWQNSLALREIASNVYSWSSSDEIADGTTAEATDPPSAHGTPAVDDWALSAVAIGADDNEIPGLRFEGGSSDPYAIGIGFGYRVHGTAEWTDEPVGPPNVPARVIAPVAPATSYDGSVIYYYSDGRGDRRELGPVTTGELFGGLIASVTNLVADISALGDDGKLTGVEKKGLVRLDGSLDAAWDILDDKAATIADAGVTAARSTAASYRTAWRTYRNALSSAWDDFENDTDIDQVAYLAAITGFEFGIDQLAEALRAYAQARGDTANASISRILSDGWLVGPDKRELSREWFKLNERLNALVARCTELGNPPTATTARDEAGNAVTAFGDDLGELDPPWYDDAFETAVPDPAGLQAAWDLAESKVIDFEAALIGGVSTDITEAITLLLPLGDDGQWSTNEKTTVLIPRDAELEGIWDLLDARADAIDDAAVASAHGFAGSKRTAWLTLRNAQDPPWNDEAHSTEIDRVAARTALGDYGAALDALADAVNVFDHNLTTDAQDRIEIIGSVNFLSRDKKPALVTDWQVLNAKQYATALRFYAVGAPAESEDARATAYAHIAALEYELGLIDPPWYDAAYDSPINATDWAELWYNARAAVEAFAVAIAAQPGPPGADGEDGADGAPGGGGGSQTIALTGNVSNGWVSGDAITVTLSPGASLYATAGISLDVSSSGAGPVTFYIQVYLAGGAGVGNIANDTFYISTSEPGGTEISGSFTNSSGATQTYWVKAHTVMPGIGSTPIQAGSGFITV